MSLPCNDFTVATTSWMPDLSSRSLSFDSRSARLSDDMTFAWSTTRPVRGGNSIGNAAVTRQQTITAPRNSASMSVTDDQNFTCGGVWVPSFAVNSAIGFSPENAVLAQITVGNVRNAVL